MFFFSVVTECKKWATELWMHIYKLTIHFKNAKLLSCTGNFLFFVMQIKE